MTGKESVNDFQVQDFLRKKKKKKRKHKEYNEACESDGKEDTQNAEFSHASLVLFEDEAAQNDEGRKKKKKKKTKEKKEESLLDNSCVELEDEIINEMAAQNDEGRKKKKKKKTTEEKQESLLDNSCVELEDEISNEMAAQNDEGRKKKKKKKTTEEKQESLLDNSCVELEDEISNEMAAQNDEGRKKKKKKKTTEEKQESLLDNSCVELEDEISNEMAAQNDEGRKKKKKKKTMEEKQESLLDNSCVELEHEISNEMAAQNDEGRKKKKKKKTTEEKQESLLDNSCVELEDEISNEMAAQIDEGRKKKKKKKTTEEKQESLLDNSCVELEDEISNEMAAQNDEGRKKKKKKKTTEEKQESLLDNSCVELEDEISNEMAAQNDEGRKKKKKKKTTEEKQESLLDNSCVELEDEISNEMAAQNGEGRKKKKKKKTTEEKQESLLDNSCVELEDEISNEMAAQNGEGCKKKKKKKTTEEKQESLLDNSCVELEHEVSNEMAVDAFQKKKKQKKRKHNDSIDEQSSVACVTVDQHTTESCQEVSADGVLNKQFVKKKRKEKLPEEDEVHELPTSETHDKNDNERPKKKKKERRSSTQNMEEDVDVAVDESLLSPPEQKRQRKDTVLPLPVEEGDVATPQQQHEGGDCDASPAMSEDSANVAAEFSKPTKAADQSPQKTPAHARKRKKSITSVTEKSCSESDVLIRTPEPLASNRKKGKNSSLTERLAPVEGNLDDEECLGDEEDLESSTYSIVDLDTAKRELEEFIPHVRNISDSSIRKAGRDLVRFKEFKKQGIAVKFGRFSQKENDQVRKNVEQFLAITGIDSAEKLLFTSRYPEDKETISRLKAEHLFCEKISEGIPRPWRLIYYRARKMFDPNNYKGRYTEEEKEKLKKYHAMHGNDWKKISEMMSRSNLSVAMKYSEIKSDINYGPWSKEEIQKLMHAVKEVIRKRAEMEDADSVSSLKKSNRELSIAREKLHQKLPWTEIEAKVGTRYWRQCKQKWSTILMNKMTKGQQLYRGTKGLQARINLIKRLHEMKVEDSNEVNWEELGSAIGDVPRSYVQAKFYKLKVSSVPLWQKKTFSEIIDYLYKEKLPELEEKLAKKNGKHDISENSAPRKLEKFFRLSDIFDSSEECE
ncbi:transcription termination factor 1 isoform X1 [Falco cherrug]|uniref:transcription termination factor 1 isoform X1 n=2 Tax=Falco cherrug TaxID=345164 RepID=UPI0024790CF9|nr:transcription termination factor 1 isoform X1 [Falco cherrug]